MIVPLHVKSHYSLGVGTASVEALVERAALLGYSALGLTDLETLAGQPQFHYLCRRHGIQPVSGVELRPGFTPSRPGPRAGRLVLLARDRVGYRSLCRIVSLRRGGAGSDVERRLARDPVTALAGNPAGLLALTDDLKILERLLRHDGIESAVVGFLLARPRDDIETRMQATDARQLGARVVADPDVTMLDRADYAVHVLQAAIRQRRCVDDVSVDDLEVREGWLRPPEDFARLFADEPGALEETRRIADECRLDLFSSDHALPHSTSNAAERLERICSEALSRAQADGHCREIAYATRLRDELETITRLGYAGYFLTAAEIVNAARVRGILIVPRGSSIGSLVVHLLGISTIDPVHHDLLFERFLHPRRASPLDIDLDVCSLRRDELVTWTREHFGRDRVAMVAAHHRYQLRSALREGMKAVGASTPQVERIAATLRTDSVLSPSALESLQSHIPDVAQRRWLPIVLRLVGIPRVLALHPSGLVVTETALTDFVPLEEADRKLVVTQYDLLGIEHAGLNKLDLLGSKVLSQLAEASRIIAGSDSRTPDPLRAPQDDAATLDRLDRAGTIGCFQVETPAVRGLLTRLQIRRLDDCVAALALVRPGAASGAAKREYVRLVRGEQPVQPVHPLLAERLNETFGLLLYDEDLIKVLAEIGGMSLAEADALRTAIIDAGEDRDTLRSLEERFSRLAAFAGADANVALAVWTTALRFAAYSFSKAHAFSYAVQAYASVYMKTHHLVAFGCALLNGYGGAYPLRTIAADLARSGVVILPPSVNESHLMARVTSDARRVQLGFTHLKHVTRATAVAILESRAQHPFRDADDFLQRVRPTRLESASLILSGACDDLSPFSLEGYPFVHEAVVKQLEGGIEPGTAQRTAMNLTRGPDRPGDEQPRRFRTLVRIRNELVYLGMHLFAHPMEVLRGDARQLGCLTVTELKQPGVPRVVRFAGLLAASRRHPLSAGQVMQFLTFEDETGLIEAVISPMQFARLGSSITTPGPYLVDAALETDHGHTFLVLSDLRPFHQRQR